MSLKCVDKKIGMSLCLALHSFPVMGRRGRDRDRDRDRMIVGYTTTYVISAYHAHDEVYSIQNYIIKFIRSQKN
jgi:hypothetical protein